jgi:predicted phosphodiesterase
MKTLSKKNEDRTSGFSLSSSLSSQSDTDILRIVAISDTHGLHGRLVLPEQADILIHCGDFADKGSEEDIYSFRSWLREQTQFPEKIAITGNHDRDADNPHRYNLKEIFSQEKDVHLLQDEAVVCADGRLRIYGASWETCEDDSFRLPEHNKQDQRQPLVDIYLSHVPPFVPEAESKALKWSSKLAALIRKNRIRVCLNGHLHWGHGATHLIYSDQDDGDGDGTWFINCASKKSHKKESTANEVFDPIVIEYDLQRRIISKLEGLSETDITTVQAEVL